MQYVNPCSFSNITMCYVAYINMNFAFNVNDYDVCAFVTGTIERPYWIYAN